MKKIAVLAAVLGFLAGASPAFAFPFDIEIDNRAQTAALDSEEWIFGTSDTQSFDYPIDFGWEAVDAVPEENLDPEGVFDLIAPDWLQDAAVAPEIDEAVDSAV